MFDNLFVEPLWRSDKHEESLRGYATMDALRVGLSEHFAFYQSERPHQLPGQQTPEAGYRTALGDAGEDRG